MTRPYSLFIKSNGYYYVQFLLSDGSRSQNKSTGTKNRREAEKIAMEWYVNGNIPARINSKDEKAKTQTVDRLSFFNSMSTYDFSSDEVDKMISIMKKRGFILSAVRPSTKQSVLVEDFLSEFWDYEKSPYVKELALEGKTLSRAHVKNERSRAENYWIPDLKRMCIGSLTLEKKIKFRPHHFLCMRYWVGNGYSESYTKFVNEILPQTKNGLPVEITFGPDSLCSVCPHLKNEICDSQERVMKFDKAVIDYCGMEEGQIVNRNDMFKLVSEKIMDAGLFESICGDCFWAKYCH